MNLTVAEFACQWQEQRTVQAHFGHRRSSTTLELYAEKAPAHEREVALEKAARVLVAAR